MASEELPIEAGVIDAAAKAIHRKEWVEKGYGPWEKFADKDRILGVAEAAVRAADEARGMKVERRRCPCDEGRIEAGPAGATYSMPHEMCGGLGGVIERHVTGWRPVEQAPSGEGE